MKKGFCVLLCFVVVAAGVFIINADSTAFAADPGDQEFVSLNLTSLSTKTSKTPSSLLNTPSIIKPIDTPIVNPGLTPIDDDDDTIIPPGIIGPGTDINIPITIKQVNLIYPAGGQVFKPGQPVIIEFTVKSAGKYRVYISANSGQTWSPLGGAIDVDTKGFYPWIVGSAGKYCIKVESQSDPSIYDEGFDFTVEQGGWDGKLKATASSDEVLLSWKGVSSQDAVTTYGVYRNTNAKVTMDDLLITVKLTDGSPVGGPVSFTDTNVEEGTTYYYRIAPLVGGQVMDTLYEQVSATPKSQIEIILTVGSPIMTVNGQTMEIEPGKKTAPVIVSGRVFVPIKAIVEELGGVITWDRVKRQVTIIHNDNVIILTIGSKTIIVNGVAQSMDVAPFISSTGSTMLPIRFVAEQLGCTIAWDAAAARIIINYSL